MSQEVEGGGRGRTMQVEVFPQPDPLGHIFLFPYHRLLCRYRDGFNLSIDNGELGRETQHLCGC